MKTAGVVFDFYDDPQGGILKSAFPTAEDLPEVIKEAHILSTEERDVLRDDAFALVMVNEGKVLRKFACVDAGNTLLSAIYFAENAELLPPEAVKVAAVNIDAACDEFGLDLPFIKEAAKSVTKGDGEEKGSAHGRVRDPGNQPLVGDEADWAQRTNLVSVRGGGDSGRVIPTANQMKTASSEGEVLGHWKIPVYDGDPAHGKVVDHYMMPVHANQANPTVPPGAKFVPVKGKHAMVDVTGKTPTPQFKKMASSRMVLGKYPLDSYADVRAAVDYFNQSWTDFDPVERHIFSVKTAARADEIGIEVPEIMQRYGSTEYAPDVEAHLSNRKAVSSEEFHGAYDELKEKKASLHPEVFADALSKVDVAAGINWNWGGEIADPWYATFGGRSDKEKVAYSWEGNGVSVDAGELANLAGQKDLLLGTFEPDMVKAFQENPVVIFESLPDDTKTILARLATGG